MFEPPEKLKEAVGEGQYIRLVKGECHAVKHLLYKRFSASHTEKAMAPHASILAWRILWTEEPGRLHVSMGSQRVGHD